MYTNLKSNPMTRLKLKHRAKGRAQPQIKNLLKVIRNKKKKKRSTETKKRNPKSK